MTDAEPTPSPDTTQDSFRGHSERFQNFVELTTQKERSVYPFLRYTQARRPDIYAKLTDPQEITNINFLGVGNGAMEIPLLSAIAALRGGDPNKLGSLNVYCEDPSQAEQSAFMERIEDAPLNSATLEVLQLLKETDSNIETIPAGVTTLNLVPCIKGYSNLTIEDPSYVPPDSDVTTLSHVLYYLKNWRQDNSEDSSALLDPKKNPILKMMQSIRKRQGIVAHIVQHPQSQTSILRSMFNPKIHGKPEITSQDLLKELHAMDIWTASAVLPVALDMTTCFEGTTFDPNPQGKALLSFLFRRNWDSISPDLKEQIGEQISEMTIANHTRNSYLLDKNHLQGFIPLGPKIGENRPNRYLEMYDELTFVDARKQKEGWFEDHLDS